MFWIPLAYADDPVCSSWEPSELVTEVDDIPSKESSGLARIDDGFLTLDDAGGEAVLHQFDGSGNFLGTIDLVGATNTDWEDVAAGSCPEGTCVWVADIGDNDQVRDEIVVWRAVLDGLAAVEATACRLRYPDGAHDAEALLVFPDEAIRIVTKTDSTAKVFRADTLACGDAAQELTEETELALGAPVTGGAVSADGAVVVLRGLEEGWAWRGCTLDWSATPEALLFVGEDQGEAVTMDTDGTLWSSSEGKEFELHRLECAESAALECAECGCAGRPGPPLGAAAVVALLSLRLAARRVRHRTDTPGR